MSELNKSEDKLLVYVWPDGTWAVEEYYGEYSFMSDDYQVIDMYSYTDMLLLDKELRDELIKELIGY